MLDVAWDEVVREECIHHSLAHQLETWLRLGLVSGVTDLRIEQRRGVVVSWKCELGAENHSATQLLVEIQDFARRACREFSLPDATIWWIGSEDAAQVRVAFSQLPFDA